MMPNSHVCWHMRQYAAWIESLERFLNWWAAALKHASNAQQQMDNSGRKQKKIPNLNYLCSCKVFVPIPSMTSLLQLRQCIHAAAYGPWKQWSAQCTGSAHGNTTCRHQHSQESSNCLNLPVKKTSIRDRSHTHDIDIDIIDGLI
jgi:hypothetical protein